MLQKMQYEELEMEVVRFESKDIITASDTITEEI